MYNQQATDTYTLVGLMQQWQCVCPRPVPGQRHATDITLRAVLRPVLSSVAGQQLALHKACLRWRPHLRDSAVCGAARLSWTVQEGTAVSYRPAVPASQGHPSLSSEKLP